MLIVTALIWGLAFSAQRAGAAHLDAVSFNGLRFILGAGVLLPIIFVLDFFKKKRGIKPKGWNKSAVLGGALCGVILFIANNLQQLGLQTTSAGKASFITAIYIVIVPVLGMLMGKRTRITGWMAVVIAIAGFWTMSINENFSITTGDVLVLLCAFVFSFHILFIDFFGEGCDPVKLTFSQFFTAAVISVPAMAINGFPSGGAIEACILPLLYVGILSSGIAFTLQTAGQQRTEPATATLLMSLESVFGLFGGVIILHEASTVKELAGCVLVFIAVFLAEQIPAAKFIKLGEREKRAILRNVCEY